MLSHATILGRAHRLRQHNCQDFAATASPAPHIAIGLVCDGCGSKFMGNGRTKPSRNETGSNLLGQFARDFLKQKLSSFAALPCTETLEMMLANLHLATLTFLHHLTVHFPEPARRQFIATHLLTTLVGFIRTRETAVFFWQGDGFLVADGRIQPLPSNNQPDYLAYQLLQPEPTINNFHIAFVPQPQTVCWLAVATDGWSTPLLEQLNEPRSALILQRWLNVQAQQRSQFDDDGAVAVWHNEEIGDRRFI
ncbi:protein phosphatase 2C domain-containing protein [Candidatus Leptofilum sp.]|uniref:protein phosphatase 2C domain-containing protein n=1 Tax=Candidatus Leptofilum sp. TaxID=3241576 RepID=UPI003B5BD7AF